MNHRIYSILIFSQAASIREGLRAVLKPFSQFEVIDHSFDNAVEMVKESNPDILLVDSSLSDSEALLLLKIIKEEFPRIPCVLRINSHLYQKKALRFGADQVITMDTTTERLINGITNMLQSSITNL